MNKCNWKGVISIAAAAVLATACSSDGSGGSPTITEGASSNASVRVLHASPDAPNVDVAVNDEVVLSDVPFQTGSSFLQLEAGQYDIEVRAAGTDTVALDAEVAVEAGGEYTVIAANSLDSIEAILVAEDTNGPSDGNASVNVVHAAAGVPNVDVYVTAPGGALNSPALSDVPYKASAELDDVAPGDYQVRITAAGDTEVVYDSGELALSAGDDLTLVALPANKGNAPVSLAALTDSSDTPSFVVLSDRAEVRVVHASNDAPNVDVFANGDQVLTNVAFKAASGYLSVPGGEYDFDISVTGEPAANAVLSATANLERGESYTVLAIGSVGAATLDTWVVVDDRSAGDMAKLTVLHAAPFSGTSEVDVYAGADPLTIAPGTLVEEDLAYETSAGPLLLPAGNYGIKVTAANTVTPVIDTALMLANGNNKTAVALVEDDNTTFDLIVLDNERSSLD